MRHKITPGKIALITGGGRGIGKETALTLARAGYDVIVNFKENARAAEATVRTIRKLGRKSWKIQADVTLDEQVARMFATIRTFTDHLDLVVNNAGYDYAKLIEDYTLEEMRYVVDVVLVAKMSVTKAALPFLRKSPYPNIINVASRMGREKTIPTIGAYGPAEAGVIKFTQCCALEFAHDNIRVNCVAPGLVRTELTESIFSESDFAAAGKAIPRGRVCQPSDVAHTICWLASENADYITGETIGVNGGSNLG